MMYGVSQFARSPPPPRPPRPACGAPCSTLRTLLRTRGTLSTRPRLQHPRTWRPCALRWRRRRRRVVAAAAEARVLPATAADGCCARCARPQVVAADAAVLRLRVNDARILRIAARLESVAAVDDEPVAGAHAPRLQRARRTAEGPVVLRAAADVVERLRVVDRHAVELRDRQVREEPPRLPFVVGLVEAAVVAEQDVLRIDGIELDRVMVDVHAVVSRSRSCPRSCRRPCSIRRCTFIDQIQSGRYGST